MAALRPPDGAHLDYDQFFDSNLPAVLNLARRLTGSRGRAEDVAIEALGRAYAHWDRVRDMTYPQAWVLRVTTNIVIGEARRRKPPLLREAPEPDVGDIVSLRAALTATMAQLPRRQREAVALRYLVDMPEAEVAEGMGVTTPGQEASQPRARCHAQDAGGGY
jgi:RNA polymerase sigma factor (sigma-70 family)